MSKQEAKEQKRKLRHTPTCSSAASVLIKSPETSLDSETAAISSATHFLPLGGCATLPANLCKPLSSFCIPLAMHLLPRQCKHYMIHRIIIHVNFKTNPNILTWHHHINYNTSSTANPPCSSTPLSPTALDNTSAHSRRI